MITGDKRISCVLGLTKGFLNCIAARKKGKNARVLVLSVTIFLFLVSSYSFAQNETEAPSDAPALLSEGGPILDDLASEEQSDNKILMSACDPALSFGDCKDQFKENIKRNGRFFSHFLGYAAVRSNDISLCDNVDEYSDVCQDVFDGLSVQRKFAQNKCDEFSPGIEKTICAHMDRCDQLIDWQRDICQGLNQGDLSLIKRGQTSDGFCEATGGCEWDYADNVRSLSVFQGFKSGSEEGCQKYASELEGRHTYLCQIMFGESVLNDILDSVAEDVAWFMLSEEYGKKFLCDRIKNSVLKDRCLSSESEKYLENYF